MIDVAPLENLGLTKAEIKTYLALLEIGKTKVGLIIEKSGLQSSVVHNALNTLTEKGLINYIKKGNIRYYQATDPKTFLDFIEQKKRDFQEILPELLAKQKKPEEKNEAEIFEGKKGAMNLLLEMIKDTKRGDEYLFFPADVEPINKEIQDFFIKFDLKRKEKKLLVLGIAPEKLKPLLEPREKAGFFKIRYTENPIPRSQSICNNKVVLFSWENKPIGYLIHSKQIADKFREYFYGLWDKLK